MTALHVSNFREWLLPLPLPLQLLPHVRSLRWLLPQLSLPLTSLLSVLLMALSLLLTSPVNVLLPQLPPLWSRGLAFLLLPPLPGALTSRPG